MLTTTVLAVKATPKALDLIEERAYEIYEGLDEDETKVPMTRLDKVKACWKCYIPAAITGATSVACLIGASSVHAKRNAALATVYKLSETALTEYKEKVVETIGEKKEKLIKDKVAEERVKKDPVTKNEVFITEKGNTLCYDAISGRYFKSDIEAIKKAENEINKTLLNDMYVSLNEFYDRLGLGHTRLGEELGWRSDDGLSDLCFSSQIADDGTPCLVVDYSIAPRYDYSKII